MTHARIPLGGAALLVLCGATGLAEAEVYRCEQHGRIVYTDRSCAGGRIERPNPHPSGRLNPAAQQAQANRIRRWERESAIAEATQRQADRQWLENHAREKRIEDAYQRREIVAGMTTAQIRQLLGTPDRIGKSASAQGREERWHYPDRGDGRRIVRFREGRVIAYDNAGRQQR
ncbi:MAG: hypothetical protein SVO96_08850 [Pseudomonadota bacterium]|nr:hypothetical protein [Pseudomonadota bacterium]